MSYSKTVDLARSLIQINTVNPPGMEKQAALPLGERLKTAGFRVRFNSFAPDRTSLIARIGDENRPGLCMTGHLDTVPLGHDQWTIAPFAGEISNGFLWGRGAADMKGGVAALVVAACEMANRGILCKDSGPALEIVLTACEENCCQGAKSLVDQGLLGSCAALIVAEPTNNHPYLGHKGVLWIEAGFKGKTAHAAFPHLGENALLKAAQAALAVESSLFSSRPHPVMGSPSVNIGKLVSGDNYNSVPDRALLGIDIRSTPNWPNREIIAIIKDKLTKLNPELKVLSDQPPLWTEPDHPWVKAVFELVHQQTGICPKPEIISYYTDGAVLSSGYGQIPVIILGPGDPGLAHQVNEHILISDIDQALTIYKKIILSWVQSRT